MRKHIGTLLLTCVFLYSTGLLNAQDAFKAEGNTYAMPFLSMNISPRNLALGGISSVVSSDAYAHFGNIAAVPFSDSFMSVGVSYCMKQPSVQRSNGIASAVSLKIGKRLGLTCGLLSDIGREYSMMDENGIRTDSFTPADVMVGVGLSYLVTDFMSFGATLNYAGSRLIGMSGPDGQSDVFFADIQMLFKVRDLSLSLSAANIGTPVKSVSGMKNSLPSNVLAGAGYSVCLNEHRLSAGLEAGLFFGGHSSFFGGAGAEYMFRNLVALRAGYHYGPGSSAVPSYASAGIGLHFKGISLDTACLFAAGPLSGTFSVGLGYSF